MNIIIILNYYFKFFFFCPLGGFTPYNTMYETANEVRINFNFIIDLNIENRIFKFNRTDKKQHKSKPNK